MYFTRSIWWLNPICIYIAITLVAVYACTISENSYWLLYRVQGKYIDSSYLIIYIASAFLFCIGCLTAKDFYGKDFEKVCLLGKVYDLMFKLTLMAYAIWFSRFILINGLSSFFSFLSPSLLTSKMYQFRANSGQISGLTSMTEFGVVVAPLSVLLHQVSSNRIYKLHFSILCVLACIRAALFSERLAILEIVVPSFIAYLALRNYRTLYKIIPIIAVILLFMIFGIFEYSRSWKSFYIDVYQGSYVNFIIDRVLGYYAIAANTECSYLHFNGPDYFPSQLLQWLWKFPILNKVPSLFISTLNDRNIIKLLEAFGNPEFNNPGGMLTAVHDFGIAGIFLSFFFGRIVGCLYNAFRRGYLEGIVLYPICILCLIELPRYFYFGCPRACFVLIGMAYVYKKSKEIVP